MIDSIKDMFNVVDIPSLLLTVGHPNSTLAKITAIGSLRLTNGIILFDVLVVLEYNDLKLGKIVGTSSKNGGYLFAVNKNGKQTREPFPLSDHKYVFVRDLVHCDVWGPYMIISKDGYKYFLNLVDDFSMDVGFTYLSQKLKSERPSDEEEDPFNAEGNSWVTSDDYVNTIFEHKSFLEVSYNPKWIEAMNLEMEALHKNNTYELADLPPERKAIGCKWIWKIKYKSSSEVDSKNGLFIAILVYVDNIVVTGNNEAEIDKFKSQLVMLYDRELKIICWNRAAENLYGYMVAEVCGKNPTDLLVEAKVAMYSNFVLKRTVDGESWSGRFPVKNKRGERFVVSGTNTPLRDENRRLIGAICISSDDCPYVIDRQLIASPRLCLDSQQASIGSVLSSLASKAKLKTKTDETYTNDIGAFDLFDNAHQNESSSPRAHTDPSPFGVFYPMDTSEDFTESENKPVFSTILSLKVKTWIGWDQLDVKQENNPSPQLSSSASEKLDCQLYKNFNTGSNKTRSSGLWLSTSHASSTSSTSSGGMSIQSHAIIKHGNQTDNLNYEILWKDLITREKIGQGSCGTVYHALWSGSNVAVKLFACQEYSDDVILSFELEVSMMKRLRHPNILLFMGAVTSPQHLCIVTEFLPRGSLFRVLQRDTLRLDWKHRLHMAIDIARGMNYLHHCNPPIVHLDLKSSNLLVDKNWTVKPQWMAPEALRNEYADEKSNVYSYGVVLWELTTEKIPWADLDIMQVIEAVGFMNQRLEIPKDVD
uniref:non-specific serine/threonine protein kinase n=1 Tax=Tanacetum cinerariifolium TaxID=118510 RepID=A0A6L2L0T4_TANCI|nr:dual specificity protein kinase splA-like [Tanacetum cinerariifolium]